jgi:hypothetical protein
MLKFHEALANAKTAQLRDSNGKLNQTDRNTLRAAILNALLEDLGGVMTSDGIVLEIEHEYWGSLLGEVTFKFKSIDFDLDGAVEEYQAKQEKKAEKTTKTK